MAAAFYVSPSGSDAGTGGITSPFATLAKAQTAMRESTIKTTYLRAGVYVGANLTLTPADSGETWSYFPADGVDSAILDGGSTGPGTGASVITILGGSSITLSGLTIRNFREWGIGIHGGAADALCGFPLAAPAVDSDVIVGNQISGGFTTANSGWAGGGIWAQGQVTHLTVINNAVTDQYGAGIRVDSNGDGFTPHDDISGLNVQNNVVLNTNEATGDNGAIYIQDQNFASTDISVTNNFIRDYQSYAGLRNANIPVRDVAIYLDRGASNVQVKGNVIANTGNAIAGSPSANSTQAIFLGSGSNVSVTGNIIDLGVQGAICSLVYEHYNANDPPMSGNEFAGNVIVGNWPGSQHCFALGVGPYGYPSGSNGGAMDPPTLAQNLYYNYGTGAQSTDGNAYSDTTAIRNIDPQISGWTYTVKSNSAVMSLGGSFQSIAGGWGPQGYALPAAGTAPSM